MMKHKGITRKAIMNVNNPSVNMEITSLENKILIPMYVTGVDYEREHIPSKGIIVMGNMIMMSGSESNLPVGGLLGDYHIPLDSQSSTIDKSLIRCGVESCKATCIGSEPSYAKVERGHERYRTSSF